MTNVLFFFSLQSGVIRVGGVVYIIEPVEVSEERGFEGSDSRSFEDSDSRGFEDSDSRSFEDSDPRNFWDSDVSGELENSENVDNIISADDYPLFEGGRRLHTFTRTAVAEALVRGRRPQAHHGDPLRPHQQPTDNLHVCDSTGKILPVSSPSQHDKLLVPYFPRRVRSLASV